MTIDNRESSGGIALIASLIEGDAAPVSAHTSPAEARRQHEEARARVMIRAN